MHYNSYYQSLNHRSGRSSRRVPEGARGLLALILGMLMLIAGCQTRPRGPGTAVRTPAFANNGAETLFMQPPPKPEVVIGLPNHPGQSATVTTVLTPARPVGTSSAAPGYPRLPTTTSIHEEVLPPSTAPAASPATTAPAASSPVTTQQAANAGSTQK